MVRPSTRRSRLRHARTRPWATALSLLGHQTNLIYFLIALIFLFASMWQLSPLERLRIGIVDTLTPVLAQAGAPVVAVVQTISDLSGLTNLKAENARLASENVRLRDWYQTAQLLKAENTALRDLLKAQPYQEYTYVTARVLADTASHQVRSVLVNAGALQNVKIDQPALTGEGVLGRVVQVGESAARVLLLTDINSRLPVTIESTGHRAIAAGMGRNILRLEFAPEDIKIDKGARIITSGDGGVFAAGLPVGEVISVDHGQILVRPYAPMESTLFVQLMNTGFDTVKDQILSEQPAGNTSTVVE
ncbi:MAG: rod shape-determining protein MreC [Pseudomonadota bacterium]